MAAFARALAVLGLPDDGSVTEAAAKSAFKRLALRHHPDKNHGSAEAHDAFKRVSEAYRTVCLALREREGADELLADPLAELFGEGWARKFAEGSVDPSAVLDDARARAAAELGLPADEGSAGPDLLLAEGGANPFAEFFDALPPEERGPMMALFEQTFPAFLAAELEEQQLSAENASFAAEALGAGGAPPPPAERAPEEARARAQARNDQAVEAFASGRLDAAIEHLGAAIAIDARNPSFYGNRSLAHERRGDLDAALADAQSCVALDPSYALGHARLGAALGALGQFARAQAAYERGLLVDPECEPCVDGAREAARRAAEHKLRIIRAGQQRVPSLGPSRAGPGGADEHRDAEEALPRLLAAQATLSPSVATDGRG